MAKGATILLASLLGVALATPAPAQQPKDLSPVEPKAVQPPAAPQPLLAPLHMEADELIYDTCAKRVIARGNVLVVHNGNILKSKQLTLDRTSGAIFMEGSAEVKEPNGGMTWGDKIVPNDTFRAAFVEALSTAGNDNTQITARQGVRNVECTADKR